MGRMDFNTTIAAQPILETMQEVHARTLALVDDLSDEQMLGPELLIVNPPLWEIGHVAWFNERWVLRHLRGRSPILPDGDELYNSAEVAHDTRWDLALPPRDETLAYAQKVLDGIAAELQSDLLTQEEAYFHRLAVLHEDMHTEALTYTRQTLGYSRPKFLSSELPAPGRAWPGDACLPGGDFLLGGSPNQGFIFDNEKWAHRVSLAPYAIALAPVTNREFAGFIDDGGYARQECWSHSGWAWREMAQAAHPVYWERGTGGRWFERIYDELRPLGANLPVIHINWYEAEAFCSWAGRRLPTEAEWEMAAATEGSAGTDAQKRRFPWGNTAPSRSEGNLDWAAGGRVAVNALPGGDSAFGCRQMIGNVWEWTASDFCPYPGFIADPYKEYSEPWFDNHKVLRGGCWTTRSHLVRNTWRNFYMPDRRDVLAGFRTCATGC